MVMRAFFAGRSMVILLTFAFFSFFRRKVRTLCLRSALSAKFLLLAYHFEVQARDTARRNPVGLIFDPYEPLVPDGHVNVTGLFEQTRTAPLARAAKRHDDGLVDVNRLDLQFVDVGAVVVLGVGDSRFGAL